MSERTQNRAKRDGSDLTPVPGRVLQRKCACGNYTVSGGECDECGRKRGMLQRKVSGQGDVAEVPPIVHEVLQSPGRPLDAGTRTFFEPRFGRDFSDVRVRTGAKAAESRTGLVARELARGEQPAPAAGRNSSGPLRIGSPADSQEAAADQVAARIAGGSSAAEHRRLPQVSHPEAHARYDFSHVRVHTDGRAAESARAINALAYTVGRDVVFGAGQYAPHTTGGRNLLAHELAHVVQQRAAGAVPAAPLMPGNHAGKFAAEGVATHSRMMPAGVVPALQRRSIFSEIAGLFRGDDIGEQELQAYLATLDRTNRIEDFTDSDNKARAVVRGWLEEPDKFRLTPRRKVLLIQEMQSGFVSSADERAILDLLDNSTEPDLSAIFGRGGINVGNLLSDFGGAEKQRLVDFFDQRFEGGLEAVRRGQIEPHARRTPYDQMLVERARRRLPLLERFAAEYYAREARRTSIAQERDPLLESRRRMDTDPESQSRGRAELSRVPGINRRALTIEVNENEVVFRVRFHVRFEDQRMAGRFDELRETLLRGIRETWDQTLLGAALQGREFRIEPELTPVAADAARDQNFWLITVRPDNQVQVNYPGCKFDPLPQGIPTSATDPTCDGGVMSIPPAHVTNAEVLGHELLHLFGLLDRYVILQHQAGPGQPVTSTETIPMRETRGRRDPLGAERGRILPEDLAFIFEQLDVYAKEEQRGLDFLLEMERNGMTIASVIGEIHRLEEIIRTGHDPNSMIRLRTDFTDITGRQAEDL